jgi:hypothetical protein
MFSANTKFRYSSNVSASILVGFLLTNLVVSGLLLSGDKLVAGLLLSGGKLVAGLLLSGGKLVAGLLLSGGKLVANIRVL